MEDKNPIQKLYYSISEVAEQLGVNNSLIRYWEAEFPSLKPRKNRRGDRLFTQKDIDELEIIYTLVKKKGFTLQGAKSELKTNRHHLKKKLEMKQELMKIKAFLIQLRTHVVGNSAD